jgi:hypothetical protein
MPPFSGSKSKPTSRASRSWKTRFRHGFGAHREAVGTRRSLTSAPPEKGRIWKTEQMEESETKVVPVTSWRYRWIRRVTGAVDNVVGSERSLVERFFFSQLSYFADTALSKARTSYLSPCSYRLYPSGKTAGASNWPVLH